MTSFTTTISDIYTDDYPYLWGQESNGTVYYLNCRVPIFSYESGYLNKFRYITFNLVHGLCSNQDIAGTFNVSLYSVQRWKDKQSNEGDGAIFNKESRHGPSHKLLSEVLKRI
ncbi:MAG: helix-turn-helix domain-containing protein [Mariniphaga sp.]